MPKDTITLTGTFGKDTGKKIRFDLSSLTSPIEGAVYVPKALVKGDATKVELKVNMDGLA